MDKIEMGEPVEYENVTIDGDLDLTRLSSQRIPVKRSAKEVEVWELEENLKLVTSRIKITNSEITGFVNFAYEDFEKPKSMVKYIYYYHYIKFP